MFNEISNKEKHQEYQIIVILHLFLIEHIKTLLMSLLTYFLTIFMGKIILRISYFLKFEDLKTIMYLEMNSF